MTDQNHITHTRRDRGGNVATRIIDFGISNQGTLIIFVPLTPAAEAHADHAFAAAMVWGGGYIVEHRYAADIVADLFAEGFRLALDGREIVPARGRSC